MSGQFGRRSFAALLAGALLATSGCVYIAQQPGAMAAAPVAPGQPVPGQPQMMPLNIGVGASGGFLITSDEWLSTGGYIGVQGAIWLNQMLAVQLDVGGAMLTDDFYGGELRVVPICVSGILSMPDPWAGLGPYGRWRLGVGAGLAFLDHTNATIDPMPIVNVQMGSEWIMQGARLFSVIDLYTGAVVEDDTGLLAWDLQARRVEVTLTAGKDQSVQLMVRRGIRAIETADGGALRVSGGRCAQLDLTKGKPTALRIELK